MSSRRMAAIFGPDGKLHAAPELIIEVLSPGATNEKRDREAKLKLYSRRGVDEYWIVDWRQRRIEVFRREQAQLALAATLMESDILTTPLLPAFASPVRDVFKGILADPAAPPAIAPIRKSYPIKIRIYSVETNMRLHKTNGLGRKKYFFGTIGITMPHI